MTFEYLPMVRERESFLNSARFYVIDTITLSH